MQKILLDSNGPQSLDKILYKVFGPPKIGEKVSDFNNFLKLFDRNIVDCGKTT